MDDVALVHETNAGSARYGRLDRRVIELHLRAVDHSLVALNCRFELMDQRGLGIDALPGREVVQVLEPHQVELGILKLRLILGLGGFGLIERGLERTRIDLRQHVSRLDVLAFGEIDLCRADRRP